MTGRAIRSGMAKRAAWLAPAAMLVLATPLAACQGQDTPAAQAGDDIPTGPIADRADILEPEIEARLDAELQAYWRRSGTAIIVASLPSLDGQSIEDVAFDTFNRWGIGDRETNRGLLVLVAPNERKLRIEVGCGLEEPITNAFAKQVIEQQMVPQFRSGNYAAGIEGGVEALVARLDGAAEFGPTSPVCTNLMGAAA